MDSNFNQLYVTVKGGGSDAAVIARVAASIKDSNQEQPADGLQHAVKNFPPSIP